LTADKQEVPTSGAVGGEATKEAALIATFYGPCGDQWINRLPDKLSQSLPKPPEAFLKRFEPPGGAMYDATAVQLALNVDGKVANAWETMRRRLEGIFVETGSLEGTWGHPVIYQAELSEGVDPEAVLGGLLPAIRRLHSSEDLLPLASANVSGGRLWLVGIPDRDDGLDAATVYLGLSSPDNAEALLDMVYRPEAILLESDLIAHKGYYLMRQYRSSDLESSYQESLDSLQETTNLLDVSLSMREKLNRVPKIEHVNQAIEKDASEEAKNVVAWDTEAENQDDRGEYKVFSAANLIVVVTWMMVVVVVLVILALIAR
jgi:hypothetical protein